VPTSTRPAERRPATAYAIQEPTRFAETPTAVAAAPWLAIDDVAWPRRLRRKQGV